MNTPVALMKPSSFQITDPNQELIERMAAFPRYNPNPIIEFDADGEVLYQNEACQSMVDSLKAGELAEILPPNTPEIVAQCVSSNRSQLRQEIRIEHRTLSWSFFPISSSRTVHCYGGDITDRTNLEAELRQAQKMESIGKLAGGIAHDFNNMLTAINGYRSLISMLPNLPTEAHHYTQQIQSVADRAADLTRQLLMFSKKQFFRTETHDLNKIVDHLVRLLSGVVGDDITLELKLNPKPLPLDADRSMIEQVILNLSVNARDAMPHGGKLIIQTSTVNISEKRLKTLPNAQPGLHVCLTVRDSGMGIDPETLTHIFEPFFSTKAPGQGTGLGLSTVYGIIDQHHGWIEVESELGHGTTFRVYLPHSRNLPTPPSIEPCRAKLHPTGGIILAVEDQESVLDLAVHVLQESGFRVHAASSADEALLIWKNHHAEIDVLFTDIVMPGSMSGKELADQLCNDRDDLQVLYTSGYSFDQLGEFPQDHLILTKPYTMNTLISMIQSLLANNKVKS